MWASTAAGSGSVEGDGPCLDAGVIPDIAPPSTTSLKGVVLGDDVATLTLGAPLVGGGGVACWTSCWAPGAVEADTADALGVVLGVVLGVMLGVVLGSAAARRLTITSAASPLGLVPLPAVTTASICITCSCSARSRALVASASDVVAAGVAAAGSAALDGAHPVFTPAPLLEHSTRGSGAVAAVPLALAKAVAAPACSTSSSSSSSTSSSTPSSSPASSSAISPRSAAVGYSYISKIGSRGLRPALSSSAPKESLEVIEAAKPRMSASSLHSICK